METSADSEIAAIAQAARMIVVNRA